ncbi:MAG TPA: SCO family protein [Methyloceanibacter sp.]|nr:SCO family protein [Methyloceanibacter sp.]
MRGRLLIVILLGFLAGALGGAALLLLTRGAPAPQVETSGKALIGGPFSLVDQTGKTVTDKDFRGRYMLVFFGFTHCPDVCPAELQVMADALGQLGPKASKIVPVFISLDPERDRPEAVGAYVKNFGPNFVGLTGSPEAIAAAAKAYRVSFSKFEYKDSNGQSGYSIDHLTLLYLMDKNGEYITHFSYGTPAAKMAETLRRYL